MVYFCVWLSASGRNKSLINIKNFPSSTIAPIVVHISCEQSMLMYVFKPVKYLVLFVEILQFEEPDVTR